MSVCKEVAMSVWLDRTLICGPYMALVTSDKEFGKVLKHLKIPRDGMRWIKNDYSDACVTYLQNKKGKLVCVVAIRPQKHINGIQIACLLVHEAVHIFQGWCDRTGESNPSSEFEAYSIQSISQELMSKYHERVCK